MLIFILIVLAIYFAHVAYVTYDIYRDRKLGGELKTALLYGFAFLPLAILFFFIRVWRGETKE